MGSRYQYRAEESGSSDPVRWATERLGFIADPMQERALRGGRRGIVNCTRQWGKSTGMAVKAVHQAMRPALAARDGDLWLMSTPNGRRGFFWEEWERGGSDWERICVPAAECPRISKRFLEEERAKGEQWYRQEYCCEFLDHEGAV